MTEHYAAIKLVHIACVILSGSLFSLRGISMIAGSTHTKHKVVSRVSYAIDTTLLASAVMLTIIIHQYPFVQAWLTVKVLLLMLYIALGIFALRRGKTRSGRTACLAAALSVYAFIVSVAVTHDPRGFLKLTKVVTPLYHLKEYQ